MRVLVLGLPQEIQCVDTDLAVEGTLQEGLGCKFALLLGYTRKQTPWDFWLVG
jgi:hypothetical protein